MFDIILELNILYRMSGLEEENRVLRRSTELLRLENEKMKKQLVFMGELLGAGDVKISAGGKSKMKLSLKKAMDACRTIIVKKYWPKCKILPKNWTVYSEDSGSFCADMLSGCAGLIPEG